MDDRYPSTDDQQSAGVIVMADELRAEAGRIVERLHAEGIRHVAMVSGDRRFVAERAGRQLGVDRVYAELTPEAKLEIVRRMRDDPQLRPVVMVGDGPARGPARAPSGAPGRARGNGSEPRRDGRSRRRLPGAGRRRSPSGRNRPRRDPGCAACSTGINRAQPTSSPLSPASCLSERSR